jgi:hypothetical protein
VVATQAARATVYNTTIVILLVCQSHGYIREDPSVRRRVPKFNDSLAVVILGHTTTGAKHDSPT